VREVPQLGEALCEFWGHHMTISYRRKGKVVLPSCYGGLYAEGLMLYVCSEEALSATSFDNMDYKKIMSTLDISVNTRKQNGIFGVL
jgi:hypothetical protein